MALRSGCKGNYNSKMQRCERYIKKEISKNMGIVPQFQDAIIDLQELYPEYFTDAKNIASLSQAYAKAYRRIRKNDTINNQLIKTKKDITTKGKDAIEKAITINPALAVKAKGRTVTVDVNGDKAFFKISRSSQEELIDNIKQFILEEKNYSLKRSINQNKLHDEIIDETRQIIQNQKKRTDAEKTAYIEKLIKVVK